MLWAIDVGNTQTVVGLHDGTAWRAQWRLESDPETTEDQLAATLSQLCSLAGVPFQADGMILGSVVPPVNALWAMFSREYLGTDAVVLKDGASVGLKVTYEPPHAVGADRIANALGALDRFKPPLVVVDFGTATTLDCIDAEGTYVGGTIMTGVQLSLSALVGKTAKLPAVALEMPEKAIGRTTPHAIQAGVMIGYASAIDGLVRAVSKELGDGVTVVSTGGLGSLFLGPCETISSHEPTLTLDGLRTAWERLR